MSAIETQHFVNSGFGWTCKRCREEVRASDHQHRASLARFFTEGEAEEREPALSAPALARWRDASQRTLYCPRCGTEETIAGTDRA